MKRLRMLVFVLAGSLWCGCAHGPIGALPVIDDFDKASEIYILRSYNYVSSGTSAYVSFDNNDVVAIRVVEYARFLAPSGNHWIGVRYAGYPSNSFPVTLAPKGKYYFAVSVGFRNFSLKPMTEDEARPYLTTLHYLPLDNSAKSDDTKERK